MVGSGQYIGKKVDFLVFNGNTGIFAVFLSSRSILLHVVVLNAYPSDVEAP